MMKHRDAENFPKQPNWADRVLEMMIAVWLSVAVVGCVVGVLLSS